MRHLLALHLHRHPLVARTALAAGALVAVLACPHTSRADSTAAAAGKPAIPLLSAACEEALALSALPARLRDRASAYTLRADGYRKTRRSDGPFTCLVQRNHPDSIIPVCFDAEGTRTILPAKIAEGETILRGGTRDDVANAFAAGQTARRYTAPARPGLAWMISAHNHIMNQGRMVHAQPHLMFYGPGLSDADIGGSFAAAQANRGLPFVIEQGIHGYIVTFVDQASSSDDVRQACRGELQERYL